MRVRGAMAASLWWRRGRIRGALVREDRDEQHGRTGCARDAQRQARDQAVDREGDEEQERGETAGASRLDEGRRLGTSGGADSDSIASITRPVPARI